MLYILIILCYMHMLYVLIILYYMQLYNYMSAQSIYIIYRLINWLRKEQKKLIL